MSYDPKCHALAEQFLSDVPHAETDVPKLAQTIQDAIEDFILSLNVTTGHGDWLQHHLHDKPSPNCHLCQPKKSWRQLGPEHDEYIDAQTTRAFVK